MMINGKWYSETEVSALIEKLRMENDFLKEYPKALKIYLKTATHTAKEFANELSEIKTSPSCCTDCIYSMKCENENMICDYTPIWMNAVTKLIEGDGIDN